MEAKTLAWTILYTFEEIEKKLQLCSHCNWVELTKLADAEGNLNTWEQVVGNKKLNAAVSFVG